MPKLRLKILTATEIACDEPADMVIMRCIVNDSGSKSAVGDLGILPGHAACSAVLGTGSLRVLADDVWRVFDVHGGVVNVRDDAVTVLTEKAVLSK